MAIEQATDSSTVQERKVSHDQPSHSSGGPRLPATGASLTTLDSRDGFITIINTYAVVLERAEALLEFLVRATNDTIRYVPGFVSANLHLNLDRTQVVNYAQWKSREAIAAARENRKSRRAHARATEARGQFHSDPVLAAAIRAGCTRD